VAGLEEISAGVVIIGERVVNHVSPKDRDIAMVFQNYALYPHMTVAQNLAFGLKLQKVGRAEIERRVHDAAAALDLEAHLERKPKALSGGQRQRVALGRAIVRQPKAFLMDEPLGALDTEFRQVMTGELRALHDRLSATTVYVTHDQHEAMAMADKIAVMNRGLIEQLGTPREIYDKPASLFVADFIGSPPMNLLSFRGRLGKGSDRIGFGEGEIRVPTVREDLGESELVLGVRPEQVQFADEGALRGVVFGVEYLGTTQIVTLTTSYGLLRARAPAELELRVGERLGLNFRPEKLSLFDKASGRAIATALTEGPAHG
jgi:multiple sugar transport system ATP-binding protein